MQPGIVSKLVEINRKFYQQFAASFDETRQRLQPGVAGLLDDIDAGSRVLDLGCGNGELLETLRRRGFEGEYTGLDFSIELVAFANARFPAQQPVFHVCDLSADDWHAGLEGTFDRILSFAVFHHLPAPIPENVFRTIRSLLSPGGQLIHANWQFLNSPRWVQRIQPWSLAGIHESDVGAHDYLLDWRRGGTGFRYVHYFTEEELDRLAQKTGFNIVRSFYSDGKERNLALYQVWQPAG